MKILSIALVLHFIADFVLQPRAMGKLKSEKLLWLFGHLAIQTIIMGLGLYYFLGLKSTLLFTGLNTLVHGIIDWYIWKGYKKVTYLRLKNSATKTIEYRIQTGDKNLEVVKDQLILDEIKHQADHWQYWEDHWFYVTIGLDQLLHVLTLIVLTATLI